jgi:hypothetical protein
MAEPNIRVIVAIVHDVLNGQRFADRHELTWVVKHRCAKLPGVVYDSASVEAAIIRVEHSGRRGIPGWDKPQPAETNAPADDVRYIGRSEAADLLARIQRRAQAAGPRTMPASAAKGPA